MLAPGTDPASAVVTLLERYGDRLHALALRLCGHQADAEDLVQDVFLQALRKWHTFRGEADPGTWLHTIAVRSCKARLRRKGGIDRRVPAVSQLMPWRESTVMELAATPVEEQSEAERQEAIDRVQTAVVGLPEHLRVPLVLKDVLGMDVLETAAALSLAENTVKTRLHRARLALRKIMTAKATSVPAPQPIYDKQICFDLLKAKLAAMDRGGVAAGFRVPKGELCARCRAVFNELDLVQEACAGLAEGALPPKVRSRIERAIVQHEGLREKSGAPTGGGKMSASKARRRRGRPPVVTSRSSPATRR